MQQPSRRRVRLAGAALAALPLVGMTGCAANFGSPVMQPYDPATGVNHRDGNIYALDVFVVADESGNGTLVAGLVNKTRQPDRLVGVATGAENVEISAPPSRTLAPGELVQLADDAAVSLSGDAVQPGRFLPITLRFGRASQIETQVPVMEAEGAYSEVPIEEP